MSPSKPGKGGVKDIKDPWADIDPHVFEGMLQRVRAAMAKCVADEPEETRFEMGVLCTFGDIAMRSQRAEVPRLSIVRDQPVPATHSGYVPYWGRD